MQAPQTTQHSDEQKVHKATMKIKVPGGKGQDPYTPAGDEIIFIPVSVGSESYKKEPFLALSKEITSVFHRFPNVPVFLLRGDEIQRFTMVFKRFEILQKLQGCVTSESHGDKLKEINELVEQLENKTRQMAKIEGEQWQISCEEGLKNLRDHFKGTFTYNNWEKEKEDLIKLGHYLTYDKYLEEVPVIAECINSGAEKYFTDYRAGILGKRDETSSPEELVMFLAKMREVIINQSKKYLKEDGDVLVSCILSLLKRYPNKRVLLCYPFPHANPQESDTFNLIEAVLNGKQLKNRLTAPCLHLNETAKYSKRKSQQNSNPVPAASTAIVSNTAAYALPPVTQNGKSGKKLDVNKFFQSVVARTPDEILNDEDESAELLISAKNWVQLVKRKAALPSPTVSPPSSISGSPTGGSPPDRSPLAEQMEKDVVLERGTRDRATSNPTQSSHNAHSTLKQQRIGTEAPVTIAPHAVTFTPPNSGLVAANKGSVSPPAPQLRPGATVS